MQILHIPISYISIYVSAGTFFASAFLFDGIANLLEGRLKISQGSLSSIVDDGYGLMLQRGVNFLCTFHKTDVVLYLVLASAAMHGRCWGYHKRVGL